MPDIHENLTPREIVAELDRYIIGQKNAKRAVAVALRNRYRRRLLPEDLREEVIPKNILMIGPTGVGKTEIARRLAHLAHAPFLKVEATKFTEVGYIGRDVDSMIRDLAQVSLRMVEQERLAEVRTKAEERALERIVEILQPQKNSPRTKKSQEREAQDLTHAIRQHFESLFQRGEQGENTPQPAPTPQEPKPSEAEEAEERADRERTDRIREKLKKQVAAGYLDLQQVEITTEETNSNMQIFPTGQGMEEFGTDIQSMLGSVMPKKHKQRKVTIAEAKQIFAEEEAQKLVDRDSLTREAVQRAEQMGIIFIDEIDKIAGGSSGSAGSSPDVSRGGVQRDILPIIEGSTVNTKYGPIKTDHILFIAAGAFHVSKPADLIPELQGRLPIRVELESLTEEDFKRILTEPRNSLTRQYVALLGTEGIHLEFTEDAITELARVAAEVNRTSENIGARRLHTVMERLLEDLSFDAPDLDTPYIKVDAEHVHRRLDSIVKNEDLSKYIL
jgi:ATP-dependent HslUV protease ATP-binding subunit HslU